MSSNIGSASRNFPARSILLNMILYVFTFGKSSEIWACSGVAVVEVVAAAALVVVVDVAEEDEAAAGPSCRDVG